MKTDKISYIFLGILLIYFLIMCSVSLDKLGLHIDEGVYGMIGVCSMSGIDVQQVYGEIQELKYVGMVMGYLLIPLFFMFGKTVFVLRFVCVLFSLGSLICIYYVCSRWFNKKVGLITTFLVAINTSFIRATRVGLVREEIFQIFLFWLGLALIQLYLAHSKKIFLYFSGFIFGLALSAKLMFLGYIIGAFVSMLFFFKVSVEFLKDKLFRAGKDLFIFVMMFILGSYHVIIYNITHRFSAFTSLFDYFFNPSRDGWENLIFFNNLQVRINDFKHLLLGNLDIENILLSPNYISLVFFLLSVSFILFYLVFKKSSIFSKRKITFLLIMYSTVLILTCFVPTTYWQGHVVIVMPVIQIVEAVFVAMVIQYLRSGKLKVALASVCVLFLSLTIISDIYQTQSYIVKIRTDETTGRFPNSRYFSDTIYQLSDYLLKNNIDEIVSLTDSIGHNLSFITKEKVKMGKYLYFPLDEKNSIEKIYLSRIKNKKKVYLVVHRDGWQNYSEELFAIIEKLIREDGQEVKLVSKFSDKDNVYQLDLYKVK